MKRKSLQYAEPEVEATSEENPGIIHACFLSKRYNTNVLSKKVLCCFYNVLILSPTDAIVSECADNKHCPFSNSSVSSMQ